MRPVFIGSEGVIGWKTFSKLFSIVLTNPGLLYEDDVCLAFVSQVQSYFVRHLTFPYVFLEDMECEARILEPISLFRAGHALVIAIKAISRKIWSSTCGVGVSKEDCLFMAPIVVAMHAAEPARLIASIMALMSLTTVSFLKARQAGKSAECDPWQLMHLRGSIHKTLARQ